MPPKTSRREMSFISFLPRCLSKLVMPGLVPGIHVFLSIAKKDVDGRVKPGHDENDSF
jgi:hypothetical protein